MNIILVIFDTLRKDCLGAYGQEPSWGRVHTPHFDAFAEGALTFHRAFPEVLPTLPARRALYTGQQVYPFLVDYHLKGDEVYAPGWGPIGEDQPTIAELLQAEGGYRTALISDLYHMFKPSKNFTRGFDQWSFLRGQELDPSRSGPEPSQADIDHWLAPELQGDSRRGVDFIRPCLRNMHGRTSEGDYFNAQVMTQAGRWLEQNQDADKFFLVVECFDPHEPWFVPASYLQQYDQTKGQEHVISIYGEIDHLDPALLHRAQMNYSGLVTMVDHWFGRFLDKVNQLGLAENSVIAVLSDHGHSLGEANYMGKRGYPSRPEVFETILMIQHPERQGAGLGSELLLQHTDIAAQVLEFAGVDADHALHGKAFWEQAVRAPGETIRDHVTIGWGDAVTVVNDTWWLNCKVDRRGALLYDLTRPKSFETNVAGKHPDIVEALFSVGAADAGADFPEYLLKQARGEIIPALWNPLS